MRKIFFLALISATSSIEAQNVSALDFSSSSSAYVYLPTSLGWNNLDELSFNVWFKFSTNGTYMIDLSDGTCDNCWAHRYGMGASGDGSSISFGVEGSSSVTMNNLQVSQTMLDTGWNNAVVTLSKLESIGKLYLNGTLVDSSTISSSGTLSLGAGNNSSKILGRRSSLTPSQSYYSGILDQFSIWDKALSKNEVAYYYQYACLDGTESGLLYAWDFDEGTGSSSYDIKNSVTATLINSPLWSNIKPNIQCGTDTTLSQSQQNTQQSFKPVVFEITSNSSTYTVPNDSILKVESIGLIYPTSPNNSSGLQVKINNQPITFLQGGVGVLKFPFWLPSGSDIEHYGNATFKYQVYGLLFPE